MKRITRMVCLCLVLVTMALFAMGSGSSSSSYQLHNKDGSLNKDYVNDMNDYFKKHPEKLP
jgi:hypothetical protein